MDAEMRPSRWPLVGMITAGSLAFGSCAGALAGHFTVTGGLLPGAGWRMPDFGVDEQLARQPPPVAAARTDPSPQFVGYYPATAAYPAEAAVVSTPTVAAAAARDYDALYDEPLYEDAVEREPEPSAAPPSEPAADRDAAYWVPEDAAGVAGGGG